MFALPRKSPRYRNEDFDNCTALPYLDTRLLSFGTNLEDEATSSSSLDRPLKIARLSFLFFSRAIYLKCERKSVKREKNVFETVRFCYFFAHDKIDGLEGFEEWIRFGFNGHKRSEIIKVVHSHDTKAN